MAALLYIGIGIAPRQMRMDLFYILGTMAYPKGEADKVYTLGAMVHAVMAIIIGLIYGALFYAFFDAGDNAMVGWGILIGLVQWVIVGGSLAMVGNVHPLMRTRELQRPGAFAMNYSTMTAGGFLVLHLVFGLIMGGLFAAYPFP